MTSKTAKNNFITSRAMDKELYIMTMESEVMKLIFALF